MLSSFRWNYNELSIVTINEERAWRGKRGNERRPKANELSPWPQDIEGYRVG